MPIRQDNQGLEDSGVTRVSAGRPNRIPELDGTSGDVLQLEVPFDTFDHVRGADLVLELDETVELEDGVLARFDSVVVDPDRMTLPAVVLLPDSEDHVSRLVDSRLLRTFGGSSRALLSSAGLMACPAVSVLVWGDPAEARATLPPGWSLSTCRARSPLTPVSGSSLPSARTEPAVWDRLPDGTVELRHGTPVNCPGDGTVGRLTAVSADARGRLSTVTFGVGHARRTRLMTLPVNHVGSLRGGIVRLRVRRAELEWLRVA